MCDIIYSVRVAIQGQSGSFHEQAARIWYGEDITIISQVTFGDVFRAYANDEADAVVVAVENTIYGTINETYRYIEQCPAPIIGEVTLTINQMLITQPGATLADITEVYSHPVALSQCQSFLSEKLPHATQIEFFDTAGAVEFIKQQGSKHMAAIAGRNAATLHDMSILKKNIQDSHDNITRFLILEPIEPSKDADRASLVITTAHKPGGLLEILQVFAAANINLASLQSQPIVGQPWNYKFFITTDAAGQPLQHALNKITANGHRVQLLGEYLSAK